MNFMSAAFGRGRVLTCAAMDAQVIPNQDIAHLTKCPEKNPLSVPMTDSSRTTVKRLFWASSATCGGPTYWSILVVALATRVGGYLAVNYALGYLCASIVSPALSGQPVIATILGVPSLGQPITALQNIGGIIILGGILVIHRTNSGR
jgi:hypothetical protein